MYILDICYIYKSEYELRQYTRLNKIQNTDFCCHI